MSDEHVAKSGRKSERRKIFRRLRERRRVLIKVVEARSERLEREIKAASRARKEKLIKEAQRVERRLKEMSRGRKNGSSS